jgi:hypothetical protein
MASPELIARARAHAAQIVIGDVTPADGVRSILTDVSSRLDFDDHSVDQFAYWADAINDAVTDQRQVMCQVAIIRLADEFLRNHPADN